MNVQEEICCKSKTPRRAEFGDVSQEPLFAEVIREPVRKTKRVQATY